MCAGRVQQSLDVIGVFPQYAFLYDVSTKLLIRMRKIDKINLIRHIALVQTGTDLTQEPDGEAFKREYRDIDVRCLSGFSICPRPEEEDTHPVLTKALKDYLPHGIKI